MELVVKTDHVHLSEATRDLIARRWEAIERVASGIIADAKLEVRSFKPQRGADIIISQLTMVAGRHVIRAEERSIDGEMAVSASLDKGLTQVRSYVGKRKSSRKHASREDVRQEFANEAGLPVDATDEEFAAVPSVTRTKHFEMKPMSVDEASEQMDLLGHDFYFFNNSDASTFSVLYRRSDGDFGILIPENG